MKALRTPEERFENLDGFPYRPNYVEVDDGDGGKVRMHYVDEGPHNGEVVLCLHGQPVWSYSYRKMIPPLTTAGYRVVAPDIVGFGRSDKPTRRSDYTFANHVHWMLGFVRGLALTDITLVGQDWGGPIGLRVATLDTARFARIVATNTGLADARGIPDEMAPKLRQMLAETPILPPRELDAVMRARALESERPAGFQDQTRDAVADIDARPSFMYWIRFCDAYPDFDPGEIVAMWLNDCTAEERRAYSAPFPAEEYKQGARQFPSLIPLFPDDPAVPDNRKAWEMLRKFDKPFFTAFSDSDSGTAAVQFQEEIPGARGQHHAIIRDALHYAQDDQGEQLAAVVIDFMKDNPPR